MNRTVVIAATFSFLCIAPGALALAVAPASMAAAESATAQVAPVRDWTRFPPADRASCLSMTGAVGTYTDLLKCLEIKRDARLGKRRTTVGEGG
jgi:hypothetical protein